MRQRGKIVRPIDLPRLSAATVGVSRKMGEVHNQAGAQWEPRHPSWRGYRPDKRPEGVHRE